MKTIFKLTFISLISATVFAITPTPTAVPAGTELNNGYKCLTTGELTLNGNKLTKAVASVRIESSIIAAGVKLRRAGTRAARAKATTALTSLENTQKGIKACGATTTTSGTPTPTPIAYTAKLSGMNVVPAVVTNNSGNCTVNVFVQSNQAEVSCETTIDSANFISTGLYIGVAAENGTKLCTLNTVAKSTCTLTANQTSRLLSDDAYVSITTRGFAGGELRGPLTKKK